MGEGWTSAGPQQMTCRCGQKSVTRKLAVGANGKLWSDEFPKPAYRSDKHRQRCPATKRRARSSTRCASGKVSACTSTTNPSPVEAAPMSSQAPVKT